MEELNIKKYDTLSRIFKYPHPALLTDLKLAENIVREFHPELLEYLEPFTECVSSSTLSQMEEIYTRTFDVQAITTLDTGYVLFGDDYKRGALLANLNKEHLAAENNCGTELADHLPNLLKLLPRMKDNLIRLELVKKIILPALNKIISDFASERIKQRNISYKKHYKTLLESSRDYALIYRFPLQLILKILGFDFGLMPEDELKQEKSFTKEIINELEINEK